MSSFPMVALGKCCQIVSGATPKRENSENWNGKIKWVTPKDISSLKTATIYDTPEYISDIGYQSCSTTMLPVGSVLLSSRAPIGNVAICGAEMCTNQGFKSLIPSVDVDPYYLYYTLKRYSRELQAQGNGATFKEVSKDVVSKFEIPLPSLYEQKRIAEIIDKADAILRKQEQALALADDFLRATFLDMFGDPVTNSKHLETVPIKEFGRIITGNTPSRAIPEYYGDEIEWIKSDNINTPLHYLTTAEEGLTNSGKAMGRIAMPGSVLVTCIAGSFNCIGNAAIANREVCFNQQINAIEPFQNFDTEFLYAQVLVGKKLIQGASTNSMKGMVSKGKFQEISFIRPPEKERIRFSEFFNTYMKMNNQINDRYEVTKIMYEAVLQRAFRGEL